MNEKHKTAILTATIDDMLSWGPCDGWTEKRIRKHAGGKRRWTALDVLALEQVPPEDRLWVVLRPELIPEPLLHELTCRFAEDVPLIWEVAYPDDGLARTRDAARDAARQVKIVREVLTREEGEP